MPTSDNGGDAEAPHPLIARTAELQPSVRHVDSQQNYTQPLLI